MSSGKWAAGESDSEDEVVENVPSQDNFESNVDATDTTNHSECIGLMMNINFSATRAEVSEFLNSTPCKVKGIEPVLHNNSFAGRVIVTLEDQASLNEFLKLGGATFQGKEIVTKVYESRPSYKGKGDRRGGRGSGRGGRDHRDRFSLDKSASRDSRDGRYPSGDVRKSASHDGPSAGRPKRNYSKEAPEQVTEEPEAPKERPKVVIAPRTLPLETIGKTDRTSEIFGGGKPHDEFQYEERKKQMQSQLPAATSKASNPVVEDIQMDKVNLNEKDVPPTPKEETSTETNPPKAPEVEDSSNKRPSRSPRGGAGRFNNNGKRENNRSFHKSKSGDEEKPSHSDVIPESSKGESETHDKEGDGDHHGPKRDGNRRSFRKGRGERSEEHQDRRQSKRTDGKYRKDKPVAHSDNHKSEQEVRKRS